MEKYPSVSLTELQKLKTILKNAEDDPSYLDGRKAPYDKPTRELLKSMIPDPVLEATMTDNRGRKKAGAKKKGASISMDELEKEFNDLRKELQGLKIEGLEPNERIQVIKTKAALIEKILQMKERIGNINRVENFISVVIGVLEDHVDQEDRLIVIDKLEEFKKEEN